jgi:abhydrolase domain-containing protein 14
VISPSMSGAFSLPLLGTHPDRIAGYVGVAPAGIRRYADELDGIQVPSLLLWGENDQLVPQAHADLLARRLRSARKVVLGNAGHACYLDQPDRFHEVLLTFLEEVF